MYDDCFLDFFFFAIIFLLTNYTILLTLVNCILGIRVSCVHNVLMLKNQKGFHVVLSLLVVGVIGVIGLVGYKVISSNNTEPSGLL